MNHYEKLNTSAPYDRTQLQTLGWSEYFEQQLLSMDTPHNRIVRVVSAQRGLFLVSDGKAEWLCSVAGRLLHFRDGNHPVTGDWVLVNDTIITSILTRKNILSRGEAGSHGNHEATVKREQAIAANLNTVFIVCGLDRDFNTKRLERYLTLVHNYGLTPVVVLTKADLHDAPELFQFEVESIALGTPVVLTSMVDNRGHGELETYLAQGQTVAMIGSSGAGKSTLLNALHGDDIQVTSTVSKSGGKGRHTTTTRELIRMPQGGMLMDNPGIREIAFYEDGQGLENTFREIETLARRCRFADCYHQQEPGCAVLHAVETGDLKHARLVSYHKMKREMQYLSDRRTKSADRIEKERWQDIALRIRQMHKMK